MVTVDSSVWVAAAERAEPRCDESRAFFARIVGSGGRIHVPAFARLEIGCALARRRRDAVAALELTAAMLGAPHVVEVALDTGLLAEALRAGAGAFVRGADSIFLATAAATGSTLVSWDEEMLARAGAIRPSEWPGGT